jgi:ABC-type uncharacterized transport system substrate-binding protein
MNRRVFIGVMAGGLLAPPLAVEAQPAGKVPRIGFLTANSPSTNTARIEAFRQGLSDLGYFEGGNIAIEWRSAEGSLDQLPALAAELVRLKVDVIVTVGSPTTRAAKDATATIPIVMAQDGDPVGNGFVVSLARPGGNITGLSSLFSELSRKRLELLEGDHSSTFPGGGSRDFEQSGKRSTAKRDRTRRSGVRGEGSIPRCSGSQGY